MSAIGAIGVGIAQFSIGALVGIGVDLAFPFVRKDIQLAEGVETVAQIGTNALVMKLLLPVVVNVLDPEYDTFFLFFLGLTSAQPNLQKKTQRLIAASKIAIVTGAQPMIEAAKNTVNQVN